MDESQMEREAAAFRKLMNNPEVGIEAKRLYKKVVPDAKFPDLEMEDKLAAREKSIQERIDKIEEEDLARRVSARRKENHDMLREQGLDPDAVEKVMTDEKIASYDTAAKYMRAQAASAPATPHNVTPIKMPDNVKEIQKNPSVWARDEAFKAINDLKAKRGF